MNTDNWRIEPQDMEGPPNREDACMVCDKIDCVCPPESGQWVKEPRGSGSYWFWIP